MKQVKYIKNMEEKKNYLYHLYWAKTCVLLIQSNPVITTSIYTTTLL